MTAQWRDLDWDDCPECGDGLQVCTTSTTPNAPYDADTVRCQTCGVIGSISADEDGADIAWD